MFWFLEKSSILWDIVEKYGTALQDGDDNMADVVEKIKTNFTLNFFIFRILWRL